MAASRCPELYTARYFAEKILASGEVVPVRASYEPPIIPLPYDLEGGPASLLVEHWMLGEWPHLSPSYWNRLDEIGVEVIAGELTAISDRHGGKPLALLDYEDLVVGDRSPRIVFAAWWEEKTGQPVYELTGEGRKLHYTELAKRTQPMKPKEWTQDRRWREDAERLQWPLTHEQVARWIEGRHWQQARTKTNPHAYTVKAWGSVENFERVVLFIREHGYLQTFGGDTYTQLDVGDHFYWTMGDALDSTVILNRKPLEREERQPGREPAREPVQAAPPLFHLGEAASRHVPVGSVLVPAGEVDWRILSAPGAMVAAYYSPDGTSGCVAFVPASEYVPELARSSTTTDGRPRAGLKLGAADLRARLQACACACACACSCREGVAVGVRDAPRRE